MKKRKKRIIKNIITTIMLVCIVFFNSNVVFAIENNDNEQEVVEDNITSTEDVSNEEIAIEEVTDDSNIDEYVETSENDMTIEDNNIISNSIEDTKYENSDELVDYEYSNTIPQGELIRIDEKDGNSISIYSLGPNEISEETITFSLSDEKVENGLTATTGGGNISIDGNFDDWNDKPMSYEFNWDNSSNAWYWGVWVDGVCYKTEVGTYDTNVRHGMQLYTDGEYVYLHIIKAREYTPVHNGDDYRFYVDEQEAAFQLETEDGVRLSNLPYNMAPGVYPIVVMHRDSDISFGRAINATAYLKVNEGNINNEIELRIPLSEMKKQNPNIDLTNISQISYFNPNLMYNRLYSSGTSTLPVVGVALCGCAGAVGFMYNKKKGRKENKEK